MKKTASNPKCPECHPHLVSRHDKDGCHARRSLRAAGSARCNCRLPFGVRLPIPEPMPDAPPALEGGC